MVPEHHRWNYCGHHGISQTERKEGVIMDPIDIYVNMGISVLLMTIKNPERAAKFKAALMKIRNAINSAFPGE